MKDSVYQSLEKIRLLESKETLTEAPAAAANVAAKAAGKGLGRFVPGVGLALGGYDAYQRAKAGDWAGAGLSAGAGLASLVPGVGTAAAVGLTGAQMARDKAKTGSWLPDYDELAASNQAKPAAPTAAAPAAPAQPTAATSKQDVMNLQKALVAKGAKIKVDGIMGPQTQAAMKQFPDVQLAGIENKVKGTIMSESEKIAQLRDRLASLEQVNEGPLSMIGKAAKGVANLGKNFMGGTAGQAARTTTGTFAKGSSAAGVANKAGKAVAANPVKTAVGAGAVGMGAGAAMTAGGGAATKPADPAAAPTAPEGGAAAPAAPAAPAGGAATKPAAAPAAAPAISAQEKTELDTLAKELEAYMGKSPELDALLLQHQKLAGAPAAAPEATPPNP